MHLRVWLVVLALLVAAGCGDGDGAKEITSPCDLADARMVQAAFGGEVADGIEGEIRNCDFDIEGGPVLSVTVFEYGSADDWDATRDGFEENRGGVTEVEDMGDEAFYPNDAGPQELVVSAGGRIFSVTVFAGLEKPTVEAINGLADLAGVIADDLG